MTAASFPRRPGQSLAGSCGWLPGMACCRRLCGRCRWWRCSSCRGPVELLGVVLPITAFLIRFFVGVRAIRSNHCGRIFRGLQGISLWAGLFLLLIIDTLQILRLVMPPGAFKNRESLIGLLIFYSIYIVCMAFAMYPGRAPQPAVAADIIRHSERR